MCLASAVVVVVDTEGKTDQNMGEVDTVAAAAVVVVVVVVVVVAVDRKSVV